MKKKKRNIGRIVANSILAIIMLLPLYWTLITSVKGKMEIYADIFSGKNKFRKLSRNIGAK